MSQPRTLDIRTHEVGDLGGPTLRKEEGAGRLAHQEQGDMPLEDSGVLRGTDTLAGVHQRDLEDEDTTPVQARLQEISQSKR